MRKLAFTVKQAATETNTDVRDIVKAIRAGHLTAHIHEHRIIIPATALEAWLLLWVPVGSEISDERLDRPIGVQVAG